MGLVSKDLGPSFKPITLNTLFLCLKFSNVYIYYLSILINQRSTVFCAFYTVYFYSIISLYRHVLHSGSFFTLVYILVDKNLRSTVSLHSIVPPLPLTPIYYSELSSDVCFGNSYMTSASVFHIPLLPSLK